MSNAYNFVSLQQYKSPWQPGHTYIVGGYFNIANTVSAAGFTNGDTITATGLIPEGGATVLRVLVTGAAADSNVSPTCTFKVGDSLTDTNAAGRYLTGALFSTTSADGLITRWNNVTPTITSGAYVKGVGYSYQTNENTNAEAGAIDIILTVTAAAATATTSGIVYVYVEYYCSGDY